MNDLHYISKLNQYQKSNLNRTITPKKIEAVIKSLSNKQTNKQTIIPGPDSFNTKFYQTFRKEIMPIFLSLFHKLQTQGTLQNSFHKSMFTWISKSSHNDSTMKTIDTFPSNIVAKILNKQFAN